MKSLATHRVRSIQFLTSILIVSAFTFAQGIPFKPLSPLVPLRLRRSPDDLQPHSRLPFASSFSIPIIDPILATEAEYNLERRQSRESSSNSDKKNKYQDSSDSSSTSPDSGNDQCISAGDGSDHTSPTCYASETTSDDHDKDSDNSGTDGDSSGISLTSGSSSAEHKNQDKGDRYQGVSYYYHSPGEESPDIFPHSGPNYFRNHPQLYAEPRHRPRPHPVYRPQRQYPHHLRPRPSHYGFNRGRDYGKYHQAPRKMKHTHFHSYHPRRPRMSAVQTYPKHSRPKYFPKRVK